MKSATCLRVWIVVATLFSPLAADEIPLIKTELMAVSLKESIPKLFFRGGEEVGTLGFGKVGLGLPQAYHGPRTLGLYSSRERATALMPPDMLVPYPPEHVVNLPPDADRVLLLGMKQGNAPPVFRAVGLPSQSFRPGQYLFFNFSTHRLHMRMGPDQFTLEPGRRQFHAPSLQQGEDADLDMLIATEIDSEMRLVFSSVIAHDPSKRNIVFIFNGRNASMPVNIRFMYDRLPPPASEVSE